MAPAKTTASTARPVPSFSVMKRAMTSTEPLSSMSLPNKAPRRNSGKNCARNCARASHEGLGPVGEERLACGSGRDQRRGRRQQKNAPAAIGQPDEQA